MRGKESSGEATQGLLALLAFSFIGRQAPLRKMNFQSGACRGLESSVFSPSSGVSAITSASTLNAAIIVLIAAPHQSRSCQTLMSLTPFRSSHHWPPNWACRCGSFEISSMRRSLNFFPLWRQFLCAYRLHKGNPPYPPLYFFRITPHSFCIAIIICQGGGVHNLCITQNML